MTLNTEELCLPLDFRFLKAEHWPKRPPNSKNERVDYSTSIVIAINPLRGEAHGKGPRTSQVSHGVSGELEGKGQLVVLHSTLSYAKGAKAGLLRGTCKRKLACSQRGPREPNETTA